MFYILIILILLADQGTKLLVQSTMDLNTSIHLIDGFFSITYIHNMGAAFSLLEGKTLFLIIIQMIVILAIVLYMIWKGSSLHWTFKASMALIVAGGLGNLIDRVRNGYVVDFLHFHFWPIFNVADISVCCGCGLLVVYVFFIEGKIKNGKQI